MVSADATAVVALTVPGTGRLWFFFDAHGSAVGVALPGSGTAGHGCGARRLQLAAQ